MEHEYDMMLLFMKTHVHYSKVIEVLDVRLKENDDENGAAFEHFIVKCLMANTPTMADIMNLPPEEWHVAKWEETFLVDKYIYQNFENKKPVVKTIKISY